MRPRIEMTPAIALQDAPLRIRLTGFEASQTIKVTARMTTRDGSLWQSDATFTASEAAGG